MTTSIRRYFIVRLVKILYTGDVTMARSIRRYFIVRLARILYTTQGTSPWQASCQ